MLPRWIWRDSRTIQILLWLLLLTGILLIVQPRLDEHLQERKQNALLTHWTDEHRASAVAEAAPDPAEATDTAWLEIDGMPVLGTVTVGKIGLREPLLKGAGEASLSHGIGVVAEERLPGVGTNFVLAGHRSFTPGKHFSRLNELVRGDEVTIQTASGSFTYIVERSFLVEPDDLSVLDAPPNVSELTLITCEPMRDPTHRLIVKALLVKETREEQTL